MLVTAAAGYYSSIIIWSKKLSSVLVELPDDFPSGLITEKLLLVKWLRRQALSFRWPLNTIRLLYFRCVEAAAWLEHAATISDCSQEVNKSTMLNDCSQALQCVRGLRRAESNRIRAVRSSYHRHSKLRLCSYCADPMVFAMTRYFCARIYSACLACFGADGENATTPSLSFGGLDRF